MFIFCKWGAKGVLRDYDFEIINNHQSHGYLKYTDSVAYHMIAVQSISQSIKQSINILIDHSLSGAFQGQWNKMMKQLIAE